MREISFAEIFSEDIQINSIAAAARKWKSGNFNNYMSGRNENILSLTLKGGKEIFTSDSKTPLFSLSSPSIILISQGAPYISHTVTQSPDEMGETLCVRFKLADKKGERLCIKEKYLCFSPVQNGLEETLFTNVLKSYLNPSGNIIQTKAHFYQLLCTLFSHLETLSIGDEFEIIKPAILHIRQNPCDNMPISELSKLCHVSESYFRSLFRKFSNGESPTDYRNRIRIEKAQELLSSSLWTTELIAETLGFFDTSHFYRTYKKVTGQTPRLKNHK